MKDVFASSAYYLLLWESAKLAIIVTVPSVVAGAFIAWLVTRTDVAFASTVRRFIVIPLVASPFVSSIAWASLASPRTGYLNSVLPSWLQLNIYSFGGIAWVLFLFFTPFTYLFTVGALKRIDGSYEEAALVLGSSVPRALWRIDLPMILPGILFGGVFVAILTIETYTIPAIFGTSSGYSNIALQAYRDANASPRLLAHAAAAGTLVLVVAAVAVLFTRRLTRSSANYSSISGKGFRSAVYELGRWRHVWSGVIVIYVIAAAVLPLIALFVGSLLPYTGAPISSASFDNYQSVLGQPLVVRAIRNTVIIGVVASVVASLLGAAVAHRDVRSTGGRLGKVVTAIATMPVAIPGVIMGLAFFLFALETPWYGSVLIVGLLFVSKFVPFALNITRGGLMQISKELDEAAILHEPRKWRVFQRVTLPLLGPSFAASIVIILILSMKELSASILVASNESILLPVLTWQYMYAGLTTEASALGVIESVLLVVVILIAQRLMRLRLEENL